MDLRRRCALLVAALAATAAAATGCTDANGTEGKGFVTSDGIVIEVPESDRAKPVSFSGETLSGDDFDVADLRGRVVVVNVWGAWCTECRVEAPILADASDELPGDASMVGIDIRETGKDWPKSFERNYGITYPSVYDPGSETLLTFPPPYSPRDIPSTMVLDRSGRVAALVRGALPSKLTLVELVEQVAAEDGPSDG